ncbi:hypothetical protein [Ornithinimicrobium sufpigmenti]|uniref:hypothetical protein n=1 Tax=Ornithinimicrobium sufpigmenti TaxID=2508882 RepID=UPI0011AFB276|nr:hypothetical protein [Ornithinimicrobium sp. HY008]
MDSLTRPTRLTDSGPGCDYAVEGRLDVSAGLVIEAGTEIRFAPDARLRIGPEGSIVARGTAQDRIVLRGMAEGHGTWVGLCFDGSGESVLDHVDLLHAGRLETSTAVSHPGGPVCQAAIGHAVNPTEPIHITHTRVVGSATSGLDATELTLGEFTGNVFADNMEYGVRTSVINATRLDRGSDYLGQDSTETWPANGLPFVYLGGEVTDGQEHRVPDLGVPYRNGGDEYPYPRNIYVDGGSTLRIEAGTQIFFGQEGGIDAFAGSRVVAAGTESTPVLLTGVEENPGSWDGLHLTDSSLDLAHTTVAYAGAERATRIDKGAVVLGGTEPHEVALTHVLIRDSQTCAVRGNAYTTGRFEAVDLRDNAENLCGLGG